MRTPRNLSPNLVVRAEIARVAERPEGMRTALYKRYDCDGVLLYVGISDWPRDRAFGHGHHSLWATFAASGTNEWFATREAAYAAEVTTIQAEQPLFNRYHSAPGARERLAAYLHDKGRDDLLPVIAGWKWSYHGKRP